MKLMSGYKATGSPDPEKCAPVQHGEGEGKRHGGRRLEPEVQK